MVDKHEGCTVVFSGGFYVSLLTVWDWGDLEEWIQVLNIPVFICFSDYPKLINDGIQGK